MQMELEYFTIPEVAKKLKVTRAAVYKWIREGKIATIAVGSDQRITSSAIDAFIKASTESRAAKDSAKMDSDIRTPGHAAPSLEYA
jgi:excisionase family DNA binding protein